MTDATEAPEEPKVGQVVRHPVTRAKDRAYLIADDSVVGTTTGPHTYVELTILAIKGQYTHQKFEVVQIEPEPMMQAAGLTGGFVIEDQGAIRFTPEQALNAAVGILRHLKEGDLLDGDEIRKSLEGAGF